MMRDNLIRAFKQHDEFAYMMTDEQIGLVVDQFMTYVAKAGYVLVSQDTFGQLRYESRILTALDVYGVSNWDGWSDAIRSVEVDE